MSRPRDKTVSNLAADILSRCQWDHVRAIDSVNDDDYDHWQTGARIRAMLRAWMEADDN